MNRESGLVAVFLVAIACVSFAIQQTDLPIQIGIRGSVNIPIGHESLLYLMGGGVDVTGRYAMPFFSPLSFGLCLGYYLAPLVKSELSTPDSLSIFSGAVLLELRLVAWGFLEFLVSAEVGWYAAFLNGDPALNGNGFFASGLLGIGYRINPYLSLGVQTGPYYFGGLYEMPVGAGFYLDMRFGG